MIGSALFVCFGYAGYAIGAHYKKRYCFFVALNEYVSALENGISYLQTTLGELTSSFLEGKKGAFADVLGKYSEALAKGAVKKEDCREAVKTRLLTGYEQGILAEMLYSLGKSDVDTQLAGLAKYKAVFAPITDAACQNQKKYGTLAFKLGILAGLAALLIMA